MSTGFMIIVNALLQLIFLRETSVAFYTGFMIIVNGGFQTILGEAPVALDTLLLLQHAAGDQADREEEHTQGYSWRYREIQCQ